MQRVRPMCSVRLDDDDGADESGKTDADGTQRPIRTDAKGTIPKKLSEESPEGFAQAFFAFELFKLCLLQIEWYILIGTS